MLQYYVSLIADGPDNADIYNVQQIFASDWKVEDETLQICMQESQAFVEHDPEEYIRQKKTSS